MYAPKAERRECHAPKLLIVDGASFATEVEELARLVGYEAVAFLDDNASQAQAYPVIGCMQDLDKLRAQ